MTITLINNFHYTEARVRPVKIMTGRFAGFYKVSRKTVLRLRRELCGVADCVCGGEFGERGGSTALTVVNEDYDRNLIVEIEGS